MSIDHERLGKDLILLRNRREQAQRDRGQDLQTETRDITGARDLATVTGAENIAQALLLRFLTAEGELAPLGHPHYGSRLHELIGEPNTEANRSLAKLFALRAVQREPRVDKVLSASVRQRTDDRGGVDIDLKLKIVEADTPLNLVVPFFFNAGATP
ncbi:GPW/gp25 family protein [Yoonia sediminilitoris]|uniref:Phage baseplate assembly protein W n=1 Tax=Yoonia sediminilitoris TaxID=1286148 RepID=A0A2T6KBX7_9RHOB|nr:GPW/gp25 family protein [Yoonia sediminilitoris]PUB12421.1 phage baseplate assembly protein W [Yoonia sediminilitoris]RCW93115.1 phage baseplate assembly protein W [Yoonia sediminilitoris]